MPTPLATPSATVHALRRVVAPTRPRHRLELHPTIDAALGGGLALGALHDILPEGCGAGYAGGATGFIATLLGRIADQRPVIWIARTPDLHPPGLGSFGLDPARVIFALAPDDLAVLAGMEIALRGGAATAVVGEVGRLGRLSGRRLHFACLKRGCTGFLLRRPSAWTEFEAESGATTRWRIGAASSAADHHEPGLPRWSVHLLSARGGTEGQWTVEVTGGARAPHPFRLVPQLADPAASVQRRRA